MKLLVIILTLMLVSCGATVRDVTIKTGLATANSSALLIETAQTTSVNTYKAEQIQAINNATTKEAAQESVKLIREKWKPVWEVFDKARETYKALVLAVKALANGTGNEVNVALLEKQLADLYAQITQMIAVKPQ